METIDLRAQAESEVALAALAAIRERLQPGTSLRLLTRSDPALLLLSLNLQLRDALHWERRGGEGAWEAIVRLVEDGSSHEIADIFVLLKREHRRLDELLGRSLRRLNAGDSAGALPLVREFAVMLRRHAEVENEVIAPVLGGEGALDTMLSEHESLLAELSAVEASFAEGVPGAWEVEPFVAMLSGSLAKHEQREEERLFPYWSARLAACPAPNREALRERVMRSLSR